MSKIIAVVRLAPGQVAFYDELTGIHLTMGNPMIEVPDYMNVTRIKRAVQNKILNLVTGSFNVENETPEQKAVEIEVKTPAPKVEPEVVKAAVEAVVEIPEVVEEAVEVKTEAPAEIVEEEVTEVAAEETTEEVVETESKPKSKRKKKED